MSGQATSPLTESGAGVDINMTDEQERQSDDTPENEQRNETQTPTRPSGLSQVEKDARLRALQNRIYPTPHHTSLLFMILHKLGWDVDKSEALFRFWEAIQRNRPKDDGELTEWEFDATSEDKEDIADTESDLKILRLSNKDVLGPKYPGGFTLLQHVQDNSLDEIFVPASFKFDEYALVYTGNADLERRSAVIVFTNAVLDTFDVLLSRGEAVLVLAGLASWDLERALVFYQDRELLSAVLSEYFDRMRPSPDLCTSESEAQSERDQRLALFITYTGFRSWSSAKEHLSVHDDNLVKALAAWHRDGIEPRKHPKDKEGTRKAGIGMRIDFDGKHASLPDPESCYCRVENDDDDMWDPETEQFMDEDTRAKTDISSFSKTTTGSWSFPHFGGIKKRVKGPNGKLRVRRPGGVINYNVQPAKLGVPDWTKFRFEYIQKGRYFWKPFKNNRYLLADAGENRTIAEGGTRKANERRTRMFDWSNKDDIQHVRRWHTQKTTRVTQTVLREAGQRLSIEEQKFLKELLDDSFARHKEARPGQSQIRISRSFAVADTLKDEWSKKWNARFAGKTVPSEVEPRRERNGQNLYNLIKRWEKLCHEYGWTFDKTGTPTVYDTVNWPWEVNNEEEAEGSSGEESEAMDISE
ncbi:hypothetical protein LTS08_008010 [Lithohypha guttulata]|nr:hypothetical protein LTS08_008010 [Lithohypha guttulata]